MRSLRKKQGLEQYDKIQPLANDKKDEEYFIGSYRTNKERKFPRFWPWRQPPKALRRATKKAAATQSFLTWQRPVKKGGIKILFGRYRQNSAQVRTKPFFGRRRLALSYFNIISCSRGEALKQSRSGKKVVVRSSLFSSFSCFLVSPAPSSSSLVELLEADVVGVFPEALPAHVQLVLPDHAVAVGARAAGREKGKLIIEHTASYLKKLKKRKKYKYTRR